MGSETLNSYTNTGIALTAAGAYNSPFTVTTAGTISNTGSYGVYSTLASPFLLNEGSITAGNYGVGLLEGGTVTNSGATALIYGGRYGVVFKNAAGTLINDGTIKSSAGFEFSAGVYVGIGGTVTNTESYSVIYGHLDGVHAVNAAADVINAGTILAAYRTGVYLRKGGNVTNTGVISGGGAGVNSFGYPGNVSNTGTIAGGVYIGDGTLTNSGRSALIRGVTKGVAAADVINTGTILTTTTVNNIFKPSGVELSYGTVANTASYSFIFGGEFGVEVNLGAATIGNAGTITGNTGVGVYLRVGGGTITNTATGALIDGGQRGVEAKSAATTITNAGTITGASMDGVYLQAGGAVTNSGAASVISGGIDGVLAKTTATVANAGTITGGKYGVIAHKLATVSNTGHITGTTKYGVYLSAGGTVTNSGTIAGANAAVLIKGAGDDLVSAQGGAVFIGGVTAAGTGNTLEFGGIGGTVASIGTQFTGFQTLQFDGGSNWEAAGSQAIFSATTIDGFFVNDTLDITDLFVVMPEILTLGANDVLTIAQGGATLDLTFSSAEAGAHFTIANDGGQGALITDDVLPCFCAGTRLRTPRGDVAVEDLAVGDEIITSAGQQQIKWIGHRRLDLARHKQPETARPILFAAGCLADNIPARDLYLSPDHALYIDGLLVPAKALLNGASIRQIARPTVTYYHIELAGHDVIFAENTPAETYLETGNRGAFENGGGAMTLHPDFAQTAREQKSCAPFTEDGPQVEAIRRRILDRANMLTTDDPAISIAYHNGTAIIQSRHAIPGLITPDPRDRRRLGVKIAGITIGSREIPVDHPALVAGWYDAEPDGRWTDGEAVIPAELLAGSTGVTVIVAGTVPYPIAA